MFVRGREVPNPCAAIRLFQICDAMKWSHLPVPGGIYDQDPELLEQFRFIFAERGKEQERENKRQQQKNKAPASRGLGRSGRVR